MSVRRDTSFDSVPRIVTPPLCAKLHFTPGVSKIGAISVGTDFSRARACFVSGRSIPIFPIQSFAPA
jgi:hypothetical protein